ncbi:MAG: nucleotidyltransferase domain-containing protein [Clostridia bacterium]|nr:nucleotidyltransferase domain-containing protein [Clostridia bacterium]
MRNIYNIEEIKSIVSDVSRDYGVKKAALFGSYASGTPTEESDIDLLIEKGDICGLIRFNSYINSLRDRLGKNVDVITYASLDNSLIKNSMGNEVVLYEQP